MAAALTSMPHILVAELLVDGSTAAVEAAIGICRAAVAVCRRQDGRRARPVLCRRSASLNSAYSLLVTPSAFAASAEGDSGLAAPCCILERACRDTERLAVAVNGELTEVRVTSRTY